MLTASGTTGNLPFVGDFVPVALIALAVWRLGHLLARERGPYAILTRWRESIGIQHEDDEPSSWSGELAEWLMCAYCRGILLAIMLTVTWFLVPWLVWALAAAALALMVGKFWQEM